MFQGSIEQPDLFAERLSYGVHSLLGHTVGKFDLSDVMLDPRFSLWAGGGRDDNIDLPDYHLLSLFI